MFWYKLFVYYSGSATVNQLEIITLTEQSELCANHVTNQ